MHLCVYAPLYSHSETKYSDAEFYSHSHSFITQLQPENGEKFHQAIVNPEKLEINTGRQKKSECRMVWYGMGWYGMEQNRTCDANLNVFKIIGIVLRLHFK